MARTLEEVYDALTDSGIQLGDRKERDELACKLLKEGATEETINLIDRHCRRTYGEDFAKRTGAMRKILDGPWQQQIVDMKQYEDKESAKKTAAPKKKKSKAEPGYGERTINQQSQEQISAEWYGMSVPELRQFKYRFVCAEWHHKGYARDQICERQPQGMGCTDDELTAWIAEFPKGRTFDNAIGIYSGKVELEGVLTREAEEAERIEKDRAEFREKMKSERRNRKRSDDPSKRPWTRNEYSETSDTLQGIKEKFQDHADPS